MPERCILSLQKYGISMDTEYPVKLKITLRPIGRPWVRVGLDDYKQQRQLETLTDFEYDFDATSQVCLSVEHFDKSDDDPTTAVEIVDISFYGISDPKFMWAGTYYPDYPGLWYGQQATKPAVALPAQTYLGWNGVYRLEFAVPVFTWMHQVLNLGWVYT